MKKICEFVAEVAVRMVIHRNLKAEFPVLVIEVMLPDIAAAVAVVVVYAVQEVVVVAQTPFQHLVANLR